MTRTAKILVAPTLLLMLLSAAARSADGQLQGADVEAIRALNDHYIRSWREHDMDWYRANLADYFVCTATDGSVLSKQDFVSYPDQGASIKEAHVENVAVRVYGTSTAVVTGNTVVHWKDGRVSATRYTDTYARIDGKWKAVSAQLTADKHFVAPAPQ